MIRQSIQDNNRNQQFQLSSRPDCGVLSASPIPIGLRVIDHDIISDDGAGTSLVVSTVERGQAGVLEHLDAPSPGSYWRLLKAIKETNSNRLAAPAMAKGTVLMLSRIEHADGAPHAYVFAHHPSWIEERGPNWRRPITTPTFHADDFFAWWERAPDGPAVRAAEMQQAMANMEETQRLMSLPPPDATPVALLSHAPTPTMGADPGKALATLDGVNAMQSFVSMQQEDLTRRANWITKHSNTLRDQGTVLANFHAERAQAMLAVADVRKQELEGILKTVGNLRLYTGEGVEAFLLCDGEPAAPDAKFTVCQELLAFDQETGILLDSGGLDHTHTAELAEALKDVELVDRMIPSELGMVLVQFRKNDKVFDNSEGLGAALYNMQMNEHSQAKFLMVRDGQRIWLIYIDDVLQPLSQLMPSTGEQNSYFTTSRFDEAPERITKDDLAYAGAQRRQLGRLDLYGKVLIALWGLQDRTGLLVGGNIPQMSNWLSPEFQNAYMRLLSIDNMLGVCRPSFDKWQTAQNEHLASGSWVAINLVDAFSQDWIPGAFSRGSYYGGRTHYDLLYRPKSGNYRTDWGVIFTRAKKDTSGIYVEIETVYQGHAEVKNPYRTNKLYLVRNDRPSEFNDGILVLDRARSADLDYYLTSRKQRAGYLSYLKLFREARVWTAERDANESPLRKLLATEVVEARIPHDPDQLDSMLTDALAVARTARRDGVIPQAGTPAYREFLNAARAAVHASLSDNGSRVAEIEKWAVDAGKQPLRLVLSGKGDWLLYCVPSEDEHDVRLGAAGHAVVRTVSFQDGVVSASVVDRRLMRSVSGEQVIHDWNATVEQEPDERFAGLPSYKPRPKEIGAKAWLVATAPFSIRYDQAVALADSASSGRELMAQFNLEDLFRKEAHHMRYANAKQVERTLVTVPIGTCIMQGAPLLLVARTDKMKFIYEKGGQSLRDRVVESMSIYKLKDRRVREITEHPMSWDLCAIPFDIAHRSRADLSETPSYRVDIESCTKAGAPASGYRNFQVTTVSPLGVELFPWLAERTRAGT